jgi:hypothetical protein
MKITSKTVAIISSIVVATSGGLMLYLTQKDQGEVLGWMSSSWVYRRGIEIDNASEEELIDEDVLIDVDTQSIITGGKMQQNCEDIRFINYEHNEALDYWIEDGCNTTSTKIWIRLSTLPAEGTTIYMYYGNSNASAGSLPWDGDIFMFADNTCPTGWTRAEEFDGKFLRGSDTYGNTGGSDSHSHANASCTSSSISTTSIGSSSGNLLGTSITHAHDNLTTTVNTNNSVLPPYKDMIICYNNHFLLSTNLISMFNVAAPTGWTRFSALDNTFPRGASTYGGSGGSATHTHTSTNGHTTDVTSVSDILSSSNYNLGTGADGECTVSSSRSINTGASCSGRDVSDAVNFRVTSSVSAGSSNITLSSAPTGLDVEDEIIIINLQGTSSNFSNVGNYDTAYITNINTDTNTLSLDRELTNNYDGVTQKIMVQRIPQYTSVTVNTSINWYPDTWDGTKGGILMFRATGTVTVNGTIHANARGYTGGSGSTSNPGYGGESYCGTAGGGRGGYGPSGNGVAGLCGGGGGAGKWQDSPSGSGGAGSARGGAGGGGGEGGGPTSAIGGRSAGGGYGTPSGNGGTNVSGNGSSGSNGTGGSGGGGGTYGEPTLAKLFFGSGGGAGGAAQASGRTGGAGGRGGGIVFISAKEVSLSGTISSNGGTGGNGSGTSPFTAASGSGGSGGSIKIIGEDLALGTSKATATGGAGGTGGLGGLTGGAGRIRIEYLTSLTGTSSPTFSESNITADSLSKDTHTHESTDVSISTDTHTPPYLDLVFAKSQGDIYVTEDNIIVTSELPPLGWNRFSELDDKIPKAAEEYGGSGGTTTHKHTIEITTGTSSHAILGLGGLGADSYFASEDHTHSCTVDSIDVSNYPSYITVIFTERKISQNTTILEETSAPHQPGNLLCEGETNPTFLTNLSPKFSAVFTADEPTDTANYYRIQVNTHQYFTGNMMWDTDRIEFVTPFANGARSPDITYNGSELQWDTVYYWRIKFWNQSEAEGEWSDTATFAMNYHPNAPTELQTEDVSNNSMTTLYPYFSAIFTDTDTLNTADYYQIQLNTNDNFEETIKWDSEKTAFLESIENDARSTDISYSGSSLEYATDYYWRIRFWDNGDLVSEWSEVEHFYTHIPPNAPSSLLVDGRVNPKGIDTLSPRFTAIFSDSDPTDYATAYQIQVNSNYLFSGTTMWDSGKTNTNIANNQRSSSYTYAGTPLTSSTNTYYWRIRFWDSHDLVSEWSESGNFIDALTLFKFEGLRMGGIKID